MKLHSPRLTGSGLLGALLLASVAVSADPPPPVLPPLAPNAGIPGEGPATVAAHAGELSRHARALAEQSLRLSQLRRGPNPPDVLVGSPEPPEPPAWPDLGAGLMAFVSDPFGSGALGAPVVVAAELNEDQRDRLTEDLKVMQRLLDKAAERAGAGGSAETALGITVLTSMGRPSPRTLYLQGFGAVFMLHVRFPLVAPPKVAEGEESPNRPDNSTWEETRRELFGRRAGEGPLRVHPEAARHYGLSAGKERAVPYSASTVEALKRALVEAARNAVNIRHLGGDDQVVIVALGPAAPPTEQVEVTRRNAQERVVVIARDGDPPTALTLRFKKADAEAFAEGELSADEFRQRMQMTAY